MNFESLLQPLRDDSRALVARCRDWQSQPSIAQVALRLAQVTEAPEALRQRPVIAALIGGTGVGKSQLFNALIGQPEASPTSTAERLKTKAPVIARRPAEHALIPEFVGDVRFIDAATPWLALADTPDLDGVDLRHREITHRVIALADILVFVTSPEKRANFALLETVRAWAGRKRWFFVVNQIDAAESDVDAIREDFDRRLRALGFEPDDSDRFLTSALAPGRWDFKRLRDTLLRERPREAAVALAADALLGQVLHACEPETLARLEVLQDEIEQREQTVGQEIVRHVQEAVQRRRLGHRLVPLLRKQIWVTLPARTGGPLALPVLIHARLAGFASAFQLWRLTTSGFSLWRLGLLATALFAALRGSFEVRGLLARLDDELAGPLADLQADVLRFLADRQLTAPTPAPLKDGAPDREWRETLAAIPGAGSALARAFERLAVAGEPSQVSRELATLLTDAIERRADDAAANCVGLPVRFLNLLPIAALAHIAYEIGNTWIRREWLPGSFYLHAGAIFLLTLLPGYLLIWMNVSRQLGQDQTLSAVFAAADKLPPTGPAQRLSAVRTELAAIFAGMRALRARASSIRAAIDAEFAVTELGARPNPTPSSGSDLYS